MSLQPTITSRFVGFLDWFIPEELQENEELSRRIRTFIVSHVAGPPAGAVVAVYVAVTNPSIYACILATGVAFFVAFPFLLRWTGRYEEVALGSLLHFIGLIYYVALCSGGIESYALPWVLAVPIVCVFFVRGLYRAVGFAAMIAGMVLLIGLYTSGVRLPDYFVGDTPTARLVLLLSAAGYITVMALAYINLYEYSIDRLRWAKEAAETASRAKSDFLARMSHELRTPLNAVIGFSQVMSQQMLGPIGTERYLDYSHDIEKSGRHLLAIINDILDNARIEAGRLEMELSACDPVQVIDEAGRIVAPLAAESGVTVRRDLAAGLPSLVADERLLRQVVINLLTNAIKFSPRDGEIVVRGWPEETDGRELLSLSISDQGPGIAKKDLERVLQPFEQLDTAYTRQHGGLGLGLPLSKRIVEGHGGTLTLESTPGEGTCVTVRLPRRQRPIADLQQPDDDAGADSAGPSTPGGIGPARGQAARLSVAARVTELMRPIYSRFATSSSMTSVAPPPIG